MRLELDDVQHDLQRLARDVVARRSDVDRLAQVEETADRFDQQLWADLGAAGLLGAGVPEEHGGLGMGALGAALVAAEVGRGVVKVPYAAVACAAVLVAAHGSPRQQERILPGLSAGSSMPVATPPASAAGARLDGDRISGTLVGVPWAHVADLLLVVADGAVVVVDPRGPGVTTVRGETTAREIALDIVLDGAPAERLGSPDAADFLVRCWLTMLAATQSGVTDAAVRMTASYTSEREQFGKPLSTFQAVALQAADAYLDARAIEATSLQAAWALDNDPDPALAVLTAAWWASEAGQRCVHRTQHLHGGMGADITYPIHRYFLLGKQVELMCGAATSLLDDLGDALADRPHAGDALVL